MSFYERADCFKEATELRALPEAGKMSLPRVPLDADDVAPAGDRSRQVRAGRVHGARAIRARAGTVFLDYAFSRDHGEHGTPARGACGTKLRHTDACY